MRELLRLAEHRARDLVAEAETEAEQLRAAARAEAEARLGNVAEVRRAAAVARQEAEDTLARARQQAAELLQEAAGERARLDAEAATDAADRLAAVCQEIDDLCRQRDEARSSLRRLTGQIGAALEAFAAPVPDDAPAGARPRGVVVTGNVVLAEPRESVAG
jgi:hypothetical protein